jgi:hypothetical protein
MLRIRQLKVLTDHIEDAEELGLLFPHKLMRIHYFVLSLGGCNATRFGNVDRQDPSLTATTWLSARFEA